MPASRLRLHRPGSMASDQSPITRATSRAAAQRQANFASRPVRGHANCERAISCQATRFAPAVRAYREALSQPVRASRRHRLSPTRARDAIARCLRPTDDTLTSGPGTAERVFSKAFAVFVGLPSPGLGCDNSRGLFACFSLSPPHCATHATLCLSTRSVKRWTNLLCTLLKSVQDGTHAASCSSNPSPWLCRPHADTRMLQSHEKTMEIMRSCGQWGLSASPATCQSQSCRWVSIPAAYAVTTAVSWPHRRARGPATCHEGGLQASVCRDQSEFAKRQDLPKGCYSGYGQVRAKVSPRRKKYTAKTSKSSSCSTTPARPVPAAARLQSVVDAVSSCSQTLVWTRLESKPVRPSMDRSPPTNVSYFFLSIMSTGKLQ